MIDFQKVTLADMPRIQAVLSAAPERGCEFSFHNMYLWGRQKFAFVEGFLVFFCQYSRRSVYTYPVGQGDIRPVLEAIIHDADRRGIPCRISGLVEDESFQLEQLFPGRFRIHCDRGSFDYVYDIHDLADLKGRKYQRKRNHANRFRQQHPDYRVLPLDGALLPQAAEMARLWFERRRREDPTGDYHMEQAALDRALSHYSELGMDGLALLEGDQILALTMGSPLRPDTFDINFEKADADTDGAYPVINQEFARYLRQKYPQLQFLNREDDMGLEGLRKAKESYYPHHMVSKCWACLLEDGCDY